MENISKQALLKIDLVNLADNYHYLQSKIGENVNCAAVVKADAYGLGAREIVSKLYESGCRDFYVAYFAEAMDIKNIAQDANIYVLHGMVDTNMYEYKREGFIPVLNTPTDIKECVGEDIPVVIHIDTGMNRLGINALEAKELKDEINSLNVQYIVSHLACAEEVNNPKNQEQLGKFKEVLEILEKKHKVSFANSSGIFLGKDYHFDQVRAGCALYGINPQLDVENPMKNTVSLKAKVLQVRYVFPGDSLGYGAAYEVEGPTKVATIAIGYADGIHRIWGDEGGVLVKDERCPIVGRISMDSTMVDITKLGAYIDAGDWVDIICDNQTPDDIAKQAKTIGYEILTSLGRRYSVIYKG